jgi:hypothetical protein
VAEKRLKVQAPDGKVVDGVEVDIVESSERWTDITLADGTTIRTKPVILSVMRLENVYDQEGNPVYQLKANQVMVASSPDNLKKGAQVSSKTH